MAAYTAVAAVTVLVTLALLATTKVAAVVMLLAATLVSGAAMVWGRLDLGYWDSLAPIAFASVWIFAAIVSIAFIGIGRWLKWPYFLRKEPVSG